VEDMAMKLHEVHHQAEEITMGIMKGNPNWLVKIRNNTTNPHDGTKALLSDRLVLVE